MIKLQLTEHLGEGTFYEVREKLKSQYGDLWLYRWSKKGTVVNELNEEIYTGSLILRHTQIGNKKIGFMESSENLEVKAFSFKLLENNEDWF